MIYRRLGLAIPDGAIEEMKARVEVTDEDLKVAAAEGSYSYCYTSQHLIHIGLLKPLYKHQS
jgi:hypothetical protein